MAALNITLIFWALIVTAMTVIISIKLFRQEESSNHADHRVIKMGGEQKELEELFVSNQDS